MKWFTEKDYLEAKQELIDACANGKAPTLQQVETIRMLGGKWAENDPDLVWLKIDIKTKHYTKKMSYKKANALFAEIQQNDFTVSTTYSTTSLKLYRSYLHTCNQTSKKRKTIKISCAVSVCLLIALGAIGIWYGDKSGLFYGTKALTFTVDGKEYSQENAVKYNDYVNLAIPVKRGYDVTGVVDARTNELLFDASGRSLSVISNRDLSDYDGCELEVKYEPHKYSAQVMSSKNASLESVTYTVEDDPTDILDEPQQLDGYVFDGWFTDSKYRKPFSGDFMDYADLDEPLVLYPHYSLDNWTLVWQLNGGAFVADVLDTYTILSDIRLPSGDMVVREGYELIGWAINGEKIEYFTPTVMKDTVISAIWLPIEYKINYELYGGLMDGAESTYTVEDEFILETPIKSGYTFEGWFANKIFTKSVVAIEQGTIGDKTVYAKWKPIVYTINYTLNGGENSPLNPVIYTADKNVALHNPQRKGYTFNGWMSDNEIITELNAAENGDVELIALWAANEYTITVNPNNGDTVYRQTVRYDNYYSIMQPTRKGHTFIGFSMAGEPIDSVGQYSFTSDISVIANYKANQYTISYVSDSITVSMQQVTYGEPYALYNPKTKLNHEFVGWFDKEVGGNRVSDGVYNIERNSVLYASWIRVITYHLESDTDYTIDSAIDKAYLVGNYNGNENFLSNVNVKIAARCYDLQLEFINVGFKASNDHSAIRAESEGFLLSVDAVGTCYICGGDGSASNDPAVKSNNGKAAIEAPRLALTSERANSFQLQGGNGANGCKGQDGAKEYTGLPFCTWGHNGGNGGTGGDSGAAIRVMSLTNYSNVELLKGFAGVGGDLGHAGYRGGWFANCWGSDGSKGADGTVVATIRYESEW